VKKTLRIGTRNSPLALWQANLVCTRLEGFGYQTLLIPITSTGDIHLDKPLYELGITGIFTKTLDVAMVNGQIDIAVHSMKDVPTLLPKGIVQTAVLERASHEDILVTNDPFDPVLKCTIATGSLRRKAQWLHRYPHHEVVGLRGNVNTRLQHLADNEWQGAIFAKAGLERIDLLPPNHQTLTWMVPAPAQGAMMVVAMENDSFAIEASSQLNHMPSQICTQVEREFLRVLEGGCTAPIGALAQIRGEDLYLEGVLLSLDGKERILISEKIELQHYEGFGKKCAESLLNKGGSQLMAQIKKDLAK
jgi:hydroxymethylbilane synthase